MVTPGAVAFSVLPFSEDMDHSGRIPCIPEAGLRGDAGVFRGPDHCTLLWKSLLFKFGCRLLGAIFR